MNKAKITRILAALVLAATVVCLCACESEAEQSTSTSAETTDATAWWKANTDISFELCVKSGENLTFESVDGDQGLILTMSDGKSVYILVAKIFGNDHTDIKVFFVKTLRQGSHNVCKTSRLNKRNTLRCCKQYLLHALPPVLPR